jgi:putative transposase
MIFAFIACEKANHPIAMLCRVLGVSSSGYYAWRTRGPSARAQADATLLARIRTAHEESRQTYGAPRIHADLRAAGVRCGRKRVARLLRGAGLVGCHRRRFVVTTQRAATASPTPDRVQRQFVASSPNVLWTADITAIPTWDGFLYLAVVLDVYSRKIVGWAMADHLRTELVLNALGMAIDTRRPAAGIIHHSDHGSQYTAVAFGERCRLAGVLPSLGSVGDWYDNAITESFFATLACELLARQHFPSLAAARLAVFDFIEGFYNTHRRHSALGYQSPAAFERRAHACAVA